MAVSSTRPGFGAQQGSCPSSCSHSCSHQLVAEFSKISVWN